MLKMGLCSIVLAGSLHAANWFPLANGNYWTYQVVNSPTKLTIQVGAPKTVNDRIYFPLTGYATSTVLVRYEKDRLLALNEDTGVESVLTSFVPGETWSAPGRQCNETGMTQSELVTHDGPSGPVEGALEIRYSILGCADAGTLNEQYGGNIGMLRRVNQTFAGPRRWDLVSAQVGSTRIQAARNGSFSVGFDTSPADHLTVTMTAQADSSNPVVLPFTSGQEYEVLLMDDSGKVVYRWGIGVLFIQLVHTVTIAGEKSWTLDIPRPPAGHYTLQAWLTTNSDIPLYTASASLTLDR